MANDPIRNPELTLALKMYKAEDTPESRRELMRALRGARLLAPVQVENSLEERSREPDGSVVLEEHPKVGYLLLGLKNGQKAFPAFTDMEALHAWRDEPCKTLVLDIARYARLLQDANIDADGVVLNPKTADMMFPKSALLKAAQPTVPPVDLKKPVGIATPKQLPPQFVEKLQESAAAHPEINKAWLRLLIQTPEQNGTANARNWLVVLDLAEGCDPKTLYPEFLKPSLGFAGGLSITVTPLASGLGAKAAEKELPFYIKG